jgi:hypothetical protein
MHLLVCYCFLEDWDLRNVVNDTDKSFPSGHHPRFIGTISGFQSLNLLHFPATERRLPFCNTLRHDIRRKTTYHQSLQSDIFIRKPERDDQIFEVKSAL